MNIDPIEQLKKLRMIEPDRVFLVESKHAILNSVYLQRTGWKKYAGWFSLSFAVFCLVLIFIIYPVRQNSLPIASADTLSKEFEDLSINITLKNINYSQGMNETINNAIVAITNNKTVHLDGVVLEQEFQKIKGSDSSTDSEASSSQIDELLNQVLN